MPVEGLQVDLGAVDRWNDRTRKLVVKKFVHYIDELNELAEMPARLRLCEPHLVPKFIDHAAIARHQHVP